MNSFSTNYLVCFINLFLVPLVTVCVDRMRNKSVNETGEGSWGKTAMSYVMYVIANLILTRCFIVPLRIAIHWKVFNDGVTYTVLAVLSAVLIAFGIECLRDYKKFKDMAEKK